MSQLSDRVALVTGATSGIGRAIAETMALSGAHVIVTGRDADRGAHVVDAIRATGGSADFLQADLGLPGAADRLADEALELADRVDILVNNAGVFTFDATANRIESDFDETFDLNVKAPFFLVGRLAPLMAERGHGVIINIGTGAAQRGAPATSLYGASKAALNLLTLSWAAEYGPSGVRVNTVSPGMIHTEGTAQDGAGLDQAAALIPARRVGRPEEVAQVVTFLATDLASYVHGAIVPVDGGATAA